MTLVAADSGSAWADKMSNSGTGVGLSNAEDVSDFIIMIDPEETPILSALPRKKATATYHEWLTESLASAASNVGVEGQAWTTKTISARTRVANYCQISDVTYEVSGTQQAVTQYGVSDELARQAVLSMKELKRDIDLDIWQNSAVSGSTASIGDSARQLNGFHAIRPTAHTGNHGYTAAVASSEFTGAASEDSFNLVMQDIFDDGPSTNIAYMLPAIKRQISRWTSVATKNFDQDALKIITVIDIYQGDFGTVRLVMDRYMEALGAVSDAVFMGNFDNAALAFLRPFTQKTFTDLPKDAVAGNIVCEYTLEYGNVNSYGALLNNT